MTKQKMCTKCKKSKSLSAFAEDKRTLDGLKNECIKCSTGFSEKDFENKKLCVKCKELKPVIEFTKSKQQKDGLNPTCKAFIKEYNRKKQDNYQKMLREFHPEKF